MSEVEALEKIASAIEHLAVAVGSLGTVAWLTLFSIGTVAWLTLFFKSQSADSSINHLAEVLEKWLANRRAG